MKGLETLPENEGHHALLTKHSVPSNIHSKATAASPQGIPAPHPSSPVRPELTHKPSKPYRSFPKNLNN
ncbi:hypothetical protein MRX96_053446 [Rhipicephalus microplus]